MIHAYGTDDELPPSLVRQLRQGQAVLFLGAGASYGATLPDGSHPPNGDQLRDRIMAEFLPGSPTNYTLSWAAELAISAADIVTVQEFIADQFRGMEPAPYHRLIPTFRWRGIATTNYDQLIETVYQSADNPVQRPIPFLSDADRVDARVRQQSMILLKLHGCITRTTNSDLPLILSADQYLHYREHRTRLFSMLVEWGHENTLVFVGHRVQDPDLRAILQFLTTNAPSRPRYYLVRPDVDSVEADFWASSEISVLRLTFEDFLAAADRAIDPRLRSLVSKIPQGHPIEKRFVRSSTPSPLLVDFLTNYAEYVHDGISYEARKPAQFYRGVSLGWYPIVAKLDVRRALVDQFIDDVILRPEIDRASLVELYVITAEAGAGKSIVLRRIAWESATTADVLCLWSIADDIENLDALRELHSATEQRIFLFIDDASDHVSTIETAISYSIDNDLPITFVTAERVNEWNVFCERLDEHLTESFTVEYLTVPEIGRLVDLLDSHQSIGPNLKNKSRDERIEEFEKRAGRQLLVALHEATSGIPFEEILVDEYRNLRPSEAQRLYLSVCVLNSFGVPVRAGVISRVHKIAFEDFREKLFRPLEHVVLATKLPWGDYAYQARHREIASIVFERVLTNSHDRYNECLRLIKALIPTYDVDRTALRGLTRGRLLLRLFPNESDVRALYNAAERVFGKKDGYLLQQQANYERLRPGGDLRLAQSLLEHARLRDPNDTSVVHTLSEVLRSRSELAERPIERIRLRREGRALLRSIRRDSNYVAATDLKYIVDEVRDMLADSKSNEAALNEAIRNADREFQIARQKYPGDSYILSTEAQFADMLENQDRALDALRQARSANPRDPFVASRLAVMLSATGALDEARLSLAEALEGNPADKRLNFQYAELLRMGGEGSSEDLVYYYRRAFSKWDSNYETQFWFARFAFESVDPDLDSLSRDVFRRLRQVPMRHDARVRVRDMVGGMDSPKQFSGAVSRLEGAHGFVALDGTGTWIYFRREDVGERLWKDLVEGDRVSFSIGFNYRGPKATNLGKE